MVKCWAGLLLVVTLSACAGAASPGVREHPATAVVFGTVGQSEWCPAGSVRVDLRTGGYALTAKAPREVCQDPDLERPVVEGTLDAARLRALQRAFQRTISDGLDACRGGRRPDDIIVSNGGLHILLVTDGRATDAAPGDLSCWTEAAWAMHNLLAATFPSSR
jgi:hypothetical protein